jgi:predicted O-methyltransferase YrrM
VFKRIIEDFIAECTARLMPRLNVRRHFDRFERRGVHVTPVHFYEPIPDTRRLDAKTWHCHSELMALDLDVAGQLNRLDLFRETFAAEYDAIPTSKTSNPTKYYYENSYFACVDAEILYCNIRHFKPKKIIEVGSGFSTLLAAQAISKNNEEDGGSRCELTAIEPFPNQTLRRGFEGLDRLMTDRIQDVPFTTFEALEENDILFLDSSHMLSLGSDVQYEFLEILPRLKPGVLVHIHDIFLPAEYPQEWVMKRHRFWNEQYFLQAFLAFNSAFEVIWSCSYLHLKHPEELARTFASYRRMQESFKWTGPGSFWIRRRLS